MSNVRCATPGIWETLADRAVQFLDMKRRCTSPRHEAQTMRYPGLTRQPSWSRTACKYFGIDANPGLIGTMLENI